MYILKNALVSISRNKGRNILMGVIIVVIACACTVTLAISNSADKLIDSYETKNDVTASLSINRENMMEQFKPGEESESENETQPEPIEMESLTKEQIETYGNSTYLKSYYYNYSISMNSSNIEAASSSFGGREGGFEGNENRGPMANVQSGDFTLTGYSSYEAMQEFIEGRYTISDGEVSDDFESLNCVINYELATLNELSVGDTITLVNPNNTKKTYKLTITGIFKENEESTDTGRMNMFSNSANNIITNSNVIEKIMADDEDLNYTITPTFVLNSKDSIEAFTTEVTEKGLPETYQVTTNLESIESETASIQNVASYVKTFLIITLVIGAIVLFVLNMINVRERKYEIGVLRTIGMKKSYVGFQFVTELLVVSIIALFVGFGVGSVTSVPVANKLLENEITARSEEKENVGNNFGGETRPGRESFMNNMNSGIDYVTEINAVVDIKVLGQLLLIGIALTLVSSSSALINISRFSPLSILKERS